METITLGSVQFEVKEKQDFSWLLQIGEPFCVFDCNDSGNLSFGVEKNGERCFVKYAGARTAAYEGEPESAIDNLRKALSVYKDLAHPRLISFKRAVETPLGLAAVFSWVQGECLFAHWTFDTCDRYIHPDSPYVKFQKLPLFRKQEAAEVLFDFLIHVEERGYVSVDFYDGSLLYDFSASVLTLCDVDFFQKIPVVNHLGEDWWGSPRFKAPEESQKGAPIGFDTMVFTLGKLLKYLFCGEQDVCRSNWPDSEKRWQAVQKATQSSRGERFQNVKEFYMAWK